jgi:hypothetical protein
MPTHDRRVGVLATTKRSGIFAPRQSNNGYVQRVYRIRYWHKGLPISEDCFRKGNTLPNCYLFHKTYNDCRSILGRIIARAYAFPRNVPPPSPSGVSIGGATNLLKEDKIRRGGLNFMDVEDAEELEFHVELRYMHI